MALGRYIHLRVGNNHPQILGPPLSRFLWSVLHIPLLNKKKGQHLVGLWILEARYTSLQCVLLYSVYEIALNTVSYE